MADDLFDQINALVAAPSPDLVQVERTLTDGYAHALTLEAEKSRIERRMDEVTQALDHGDTATKARELTSLAKRREGNADTLSKLRALLASLRRHAEDVRVGSPAR